MFLHHEDVAAGAFGDAGRLGRLLEISLGVIFGQQIGGRVGRAFCHQARFRAGAFRTGASSSFSAAFFAAEALAGALAGLVFTALSLAALGFSRLRLSAAMRSTTFEPRDWAGSSSSVSIVLP